jgi:hypothetical protein
VKKKDVRDFLERLFFRLLADKEKRGSFSAPPFFNLYRSALIVTDHGAEKTRGTSRAAPVGADTDGH